MSRGLLDQEEINKILEVLQGSDAMMKENYEVLNLYTIDFKLHLL